VFLPSAMGARLCRRSGYPVQRAGTTFHDPVWYGKLLSPSWKMQGTTASSLMYQAKDDWLPHRRRKKPRRN
jgi:hypothetical protein